MNRKAESGPARGGSAKGGAGGGSLRGAGNGSVSGQGSSQTALPSRADSRAAPRGPTASRESFQAAYAVGANPSARCQVGRTAGGAKANTVGPAAARSGADAGNSSRGG